MDVELPPGRFEITLGADDLPTRLELSVEGTDARYTESVEFADWGADIAIGTPEGEIDETPWLDEEALAEVRGTVQALAPTAVPDGLVLGMHRGDVRGGLPRSIGEEPCAQLIPGLQAPAHGRGLPRRGGTSRVTTCHVSLLPLELRPRVRRHAVRAGRVRRGAVTRRTTASSRSSSGETVVQFDTTYTSELPAMVASIQPFDLDAELARLAPLAEQMWNDVSGADGGWFAYAPS